MRRIIFAFVAVIALVLLRRFSVLLEFITWGELGWICFAGVFALLLWSIPKPVTEFVQASLSPSEQMLMAKIRMINSASEESERIRIRVKDEWVEGKVLEMSESHGVFLMKTRPGDTKPNDLIHLSDVIRVQTARETLNRLLKS